MHGMLMNSETTFRSKASMIEFTLELISSGRFLGPPPPEAEFARLLESLGPSLLVFSSGSNEFETEEGR